MITFRFTCEERKIYSTIKKSQNIMNMIFCKTFSLIFMSLLTALIVKNSHILAGIYFAFLKKRPRLNLKGFQYQLWTSMKTSEK